MSTETKEVTVMISRRVKPGRKLEYANWFGRITEAIKKSPGFRGITVLVPNDSNSRIVLYRFANAGALENWESSPERKKLMSEIDEYATQVYEKAGGLETWFHVSDARSV